MRLLVTCHRDPFTHFGGSEKAIRSIAAHLNRMGHRVTIVTKREPGVPYQSIHDGVESLAAFDPLNTGPFMTNRKLSAFLGFFGWDGVLLFGQNVWVTDEIWRDVGWWKNWASHAKVVYMPVGLPDFRNWKKLIYFHVVQDHLIENADTVVALTRDEVGQIRRLGRPPQLIQIPLGVDNAEFSDGHDESVRERYHIPDGPLIINVGGNYQNKNLPMACLSVARLNQFLPGRPATLVLIGCDTERYTNSWVRGLGMIPDRDKNALYQEADVLLQTSSFEGFGLTLLEGLASGIPFVSTAVGVAEELGDQGGGGRIRDLHDDGVAYRLWQGMQEPRDPEMLRSIAKRYDWSKVVPRLEALMR